MSETKFTKGPWKVVDNRPKVDYPVKKGMEWVKNTIEIVGFKKYTGELTCVARIDHRIGYYPIDDEDIANSKLLAAAPDMYEALECACDKYCIGYAGDSLVKCEDCIIQKALRKARGKEE